MDITNTTPKLSNLNTPPIDARSEASVDDSKDVSVINTSTAITAVDGVDVATSTDAGGDASLGAPPTPPINSSVDVAAGSSIFAENITAAIDELTQGGTIPLSECSADDMAAVFAKLNIFNDESELTAQNELADATSQLNKQAIDAAREALKQAKADLDKATGKGRKRRGLLGSILMALNPAAAVMMFMGGRMKVKAAKGAVDKAQKRLDELMKNVGESQKDNAKKLEAQQQAAVDALKEATASAGPDGVPAKDMAAMLKPGAAAVLNALLQVGKEGDLDAILVLAPDMIRDTVLPMLEAAGVDNPKGAADEIAAIYLTELLGQFSPEERAAVVTELGSGTADLGAHLEDGLDTDASAGADTLSEWAAESQQSGQRNVYIS